MRKSLPTVTCLLLLAPILPAHAQLTGFTVAFRNTGKGPRLIATHNRPTPVAAIALKQVCSSGDSYILWDPLLTYGLELSLPQTQEAEISGPTSTNNCSLSVVSALFTNGASEGDSQGLDHILLRRRGTYSELTGISRQLHASTLKQGDPTGVMLWLQSQDSALKTGHYDPWEWSGRSSVIVFTQFLLQRKALPNVPPSTLNALPTERGLMLSKGFSRQEAYAQAFSARIDQWTSDLYNALPAAYRLPPTPAN